MAAHLRTFLKECGSFAHTIFPGKCYICAHQILFSGKWYVCARKNVSPHFYIFLSHFCMYFVVISNPSDTSCLIQAIIISSPLGTTYFVTKYVICSVVLFNCMLIKTQSLLYCLVFKMEHLELFHFQVGEQGNSVDIFRTLI